LVMAQRVSRVVAIEQTGFTAAGTKPDMKY
jgi:hypothetical protein